MDEWNVPKEKLKKKKINILHGILKEIGELVGQNAKKKSLKN